MYYVQKDIECSKCHQKNNFRTIIKELKDKSKQTIYKCNNCKHESVQSIVTISTSGQEGTFITLPQTPKTTLF